MAFVECSWSILVLKDIQGGEYAVTDTKYELILLLMWQDWESGLKEYSYFPYLLWSGLRDYLLSVQWSNVKIVLILKRRRPSSWKLKGGTEHKTLWNFEFYTAMLWNLEFWCNWLLLDATLTCYRCFSVTCCLDLHGRSGLMMEAVLDKHAASIVVW